MFWFIPTTHRVVIVVLLVVAALTFALFWVTRLWARRRGRRAQAEVIGLAAVRHRSGRPEPPAE